jgi:hypothetical protein
VNILFLKGGDESGWGGCGDLPAFAVHGLDRNINPALAANTTG